MNESKASRYQRLRRRAHAAGLVSAAVMLAAIASSPVAHGIAGLAEAFATGLSGILAAAASLALFVVLVVSLWELASLPAMIYLARRVDRRYGVAAPSVEEVLGAQLRATAVALPAAFVAGGVIQISVFIAGAGWWLVAGLCLALALAGAIRMAPFVLASLADVRPLSRPALRARVTDLARRSGLSIERIDEWVVDETAHTTALVAGVGSTRRVLISSELARHWSDDEIAVVVAHELGHHVHRDLWRTFALDVAVLCVSLAATDLVVRRFAAALGISGPGDLAALPLVALVASMVWMAATPIRHAQSRSQERRADMFALALTGGADAFGAAIRRLGTRLLAEERPSALTRWLYYRHPSIAERLALADAYRRRADRV